MTCAVRVSPGPTQTLERVAHGRNPSPGMVASSATDRLGLSPPARRPHQHLVDRHSTRTSDDKADRTGDVSAAKSSMDPNRARMFSRTSGGCARRAPSRLRPARRGSRARDGRTSWRNDSLNAPTPTWSRCTHHFLHAPPAGDELTLTMSATPAGRRLLPSRDAAVQHVCSTGAQQVQLDHSATRRRARRRPPRSMTPALFTSVSSGRTRQRFARPSHELPLRRSIDFEGEDVTVLARRSARHRGGPCAGSDDHPGPVEHKGFGGGFTDPATGTGDDGHRSGKRVGHDLSFSSQHQRLGVPAGTV